jgi:RecA/RadA recombinase
MSLLDKLRKNTTIKQSEILNKSKFFGDKDMIQTPVPMVNVALSGRLDGGLTPGLTVLAGPSKHFKTAFALLFAKSYMEKYEDAVVLFYDSEFGSPQSYFDSFGIQTDKVFHTPITDIEQLKHDVMNQLNNLDRNEHVIIIVDSVGNLASKKEVDDALEGKSVADMTRAKQMKSLFRMITPHLTIKDIPMIVVNHTYQEIGLFPKQIVSGGTGVVYSADNIWILGRQQEKDGSDIIGYNFIINVEKSRYVKEKSKIPITVNFQGGMSKWSGLIDIALESGHVFKPTNGWYSRKGEEKKHRLADTDTKEFWMPILKDKTFQEYIETKYKLAGGNLMQSAMSDDDISEEFENADSV